MKSINFDLNFDQTHWICSNTDISLRADSLENLDAEIKNYLQKKYKKGDFKVKMFFDFERFPLWMRQYMAHYFNRELTYQL